MVVGGGGWDGVGVVGVGLATAEADGAVRRPRGDDSIGTPMQAGPSIEYSAGQARTDSQSRGAL